MRGLGLVDVLQRGAVLAHHPRGQPHALVGQLEVPVPLDGEQTVVTTRTHVKALLVPLIILLVWLGILIGTPLGFLFGVSPLLSRMKTLPWAVAWPMFLS